ncbi:MAG: exo-alpha-sialidase [Sandaracinaceae bacterium]|nr:exo-alpha-sialidase [Sandaracinaceae bacterium]
MLAGVRTALLLLLCPSVAIAHGRPAALGRIVQDPSRPSRLVAQATWGLAISEDGGARWQWLCAAALGVDARNQDPPIAISGDGTILASTFDGLITSRDHACTWGTPSDALRDVYTIDVVRAPGPPERLLAISTGSIEPDTLWQSEDLGATFTPLATDFGQGVLLDQARVAPSRPGRIYLSAHIAGDVATRRVLLLSSDDGGASFQPHALPIAGTEWGGWILGVSPDDPDVVFVRVTHFDGEEVPERILRTRDGGTNWEEVLRLPYTGGMTYGPDGAILIASRRGGVHRSEDGGDSFRVVDATLALTCLHTIDGTIWACADNARSGYAIGRSQDGVTFEPVATLSDIGALYACPSCSPAGYLCPHWLPDVIVDLHLDADLPDGYVVTEAGTGLPRDAAPPAECIDASALDGGIDAGPASAAAGCGCRIAARKKDRGLWALFAAALGLAITRDRARRAGAARARACAGARRASDRAGAAPPRCRRG